MPENPRSEWDWQTLLADEMARNSRLYCKVAYGVLRDATAADDVCQQAFLKALLKQKELRNEESLRAWLVKMVVNESLAVLRRKKVEARALVERIRPPAAVVAEGADWELREAVMEGVDTLPEPVRAIVVMRLLDGMSGAEVMEALGCSESHVSRQLHGGMVILRTALEEWRNIRGK